MNLAASSTYTGATTISAGKLVLDHSGANTGALGNTAVSIGGSGMLQVRGNTNLGNGAGGTLNIVSSGVLSLQDNSINTFTTGGNLTLNNLAALNFELGTSNGINDLLKVGSTGTGAVSITSGTVTLNVAALSNLATGTTSYTIITAGSGLGSGFILGAVPAGFNTYSLSSSTSTAEILTVTATANPNTAYWSGVASSTLSPSDPNNNWGYGSLLGSTSNWSTNLAGTTDAHQVPGSNTDVIFTAQNATPSGTAVNTQLDGAYAIKGLTINTTGTTATINSIGIDLRGNNLTIGADGLTLTSGATTINDTLGGGSVLVSANQSWANNSSSQALTINSAIGSNATVGITQTLTLNGTGAVTLGGIVSDGPNSGKLALQFNQSGIATLTNNNTFTGSTIISGGAAYGSGTGATVILADTTGAALQSADIEIGKASSSVSSILKMGAANQFGPNSVLTFNALGGFPTQAVFKLMGFNQTVAGISSGSDIQNTIENTESEGSVGAATLTINNTNNYTYAGTIRNTFNGTSVGTLSLIKTGSGTQTLSGSAIAYTGGTTISNGVLILQGAAFSTAARNYSIASGAVLSLTGLGGTVSSGTSIPAGTTTISGSGTLTIASGSLNDNSGPRTLNISLGSGGLIDIQSAASMQNGGFAAVNWASNLAGLNVNGLLDLWDGNTVIVDALTGAGTITHTSFGASTTLQIGTNGGSGNFTGLITDTSGLATVLTKTGAGTQILSGANTYTGSTTISAGVLQLGNALSVQNSTVTVSATNGLTFSPSIGTFTLGGLSGASNFALADTGSTAVTLQAGNNNTSSTYSGVMSGSGSLVKIGTGTLTLSGLSTYTGNVSINQGTLIEANAGQFAVQATSSALGNPATAGRTVTIASGATLQFGGDNQWGGPTGTAPNLALLISGNVVGFNGNMNTLGNITLSGGTLTTNNGFNATNESFYLKGGTITVSGSSALHDQCQWQHQQWHSTCQQHDV